MSALLSWNERLAALAVTADRRGLYVTGVALRVSARLLWSIWYERARWEQRNTADDLAREHAVNAPGGAA